MTIAVLTGWDDILQLEQEWRDLLPEASDSNLFMTWEWTDSIREAFGATTSPFVVAVRNSQQELVGVAPLFLCRYRFAGTVSLTALRPLPNVLRGSAYVNLIARPDEWATVSAGVLQALSQHGSAWDIALLDRVASWKIADSGNIPDLARDAGFTVRSRRRVFSGFDLPASLDAFRQQLSRRFRGNLGADIRRTHNQGNTQLRYCLRPEDVDQFLDVLFALHTRRWNSLGLPGSFRDWPQRRQFYRAFARKALERGWLVLCLYEIDGTARAAQIGFVYGNRYYAFQEGFDPDFTSGVGNSMRFEMIGDLIDRGVAYYDFLGGYSDHKRRWSATERDGHDVLLAHHNVAARTLLRLGFWPTGRFVKQLDQEPQL